LKLYFEEAEGAALGWIADGCGGRSAMQTSSTSNSPDYQAAVKTVIRRIRSHFVIFELLTLNQDTLDSNHHTRDEVLNWKRCFRGTHQRHSSTSVVFEDEVIVLAHVAISWRRRQDGSLTSIVA